MIALVLTGALLSTLGGAAAAAPASDAASPQPITGGPTIAGVCVLSPEAVLTASKVGQSTTARLQRFAADAQHEIQAQRTPLETDARALDAKSKSLPAAELRQQQQAIANRAQALQAQTEQRNRELEATRVHVVQRILQQAQPLVVTAYATHHCGLLFRRDGVLGGNMANDLTPEVVQALDAKVTTMSFDREVLPAPSTGGVKPGA